MVKTELGFCGCQATNPGKIHIVQSMRILDPRNTPINLTPEDRDVKVLLVPDSGVQSVVVFPIIRDNTEFTVEHLLAKLKSNLRDVEIIRVYLVSDQVNHIRYVIMIRKKSRCNSSANSETPSSSTSSSNSTPVKSSRKRKRSTPTYSYAKKSETIIEITCSNTDQRLTLDLRRNAQVIVTYPTRPSEHGITITIEDFKCLEHDEYLNDIIIDFYLRYLVLEHLPKKDQERVYVFNTFFYTKLTSPKYSMANPNMSLEMLQHTEVKKWTKNVNIFEKDFLFIPINQKDHWFLAIICYPALIGEKKETKNSSLSLESHQYPCIVIFDSLPSVSISRPKVVKNLKNYLTCEYSTKNEESDLLLNNLQVIYADVPQQLNLSDCGLYLLQFVEQFFKDFVITKSLQALKKPLNKWFKTDVIKDKREEIKKLIIRLAIDSRKP